MPRKTIRLQDLKPWQIAVLCVIIAIALLPSLFSGCNGPKSEKPVEPGEYLFCFWNLENLFDDHFDGRTGPGDKEHDPWHANNPEILKLKLDHLSEAIMKLNGGRGPDILAFCEVESVRAAELLKDALNQRLPDPADKYQYVLMKNIAGGRHIAPGIITRLPVEADRTKTHGSRLRIVEGHLLAGDRELILFVSHWTSRVKDSGEAGRSSYADKIYGAANAIFKANPKADILICGDFNDNPDDTAVIENLHATGDINKVRGSAESLMLFNLMADKDPSKFGTHYYSGWHIFDQIVVSPGMLDNDGWSCVVESVETIRTLTKPGDRIGRPWRFGSEKEKGTRGYSDHFPVTVKLKVHAPG